MEHEFWHHKWANNQLGFHQDQPNPMLKDHLQTLELPVEARIFVPLCGKTLDIGWLLSKGYRVVGAELNESAVRQLFDELGVKPLVQSHGNHQRFSADQIDIFQGDFFELKSQSIGKIDAVYDRAALVALPENMRVSYTEHLCQLSKSAPQLVVCYQYDSTQLAGPPFSITDEQMFDYYDDHYTLSLLIEVDVEGGFKGQYPATEKAWLLSEKQ